MMQSLDSFRNFINRNFPLKVLCWSLLSLLSLSILFAIIYPIIGCGGYGFQMPCTSYFTQNINLCRVNSKGYCCGTMGTVSCGPYTNCVEQPTPLTIPKCAGILITSWVLQILTLIVTIAFFWMLYARRNDANGDPNYARMGDRQVQIGSGPQNHAYRQFAGRGIPLA